MRRIEFGSIGLWLALLCGCHTDRSTQPTTLANAPGQSKVRALSSEQIARVEQFCSACHALPIPSTFPKSRWEEEVEQGFEFYIASQRTDLEEPTRAQAVRYFRDAAPESIEIPSVLSEFAPHRFEKSAPVELRSSGGVCVSFLHWHALSGSLLMSDMRGGHVRLLTPARQWQVEELGQVSNSCRVTRCDWNSDNRDDFLVCDLGSFPVGDHDRGQLQLWLASETGQYDVHVLARNLGRVVEAQAFDYDEDGDTDVLIAEFGWRTTGGMKLLRNGGSPALTSDNLVLEVLDARHGPLGVQVADFDLDGRLDYLVSYGQEIETVELFYNQGRGRYQQVVIFSLADPSYNSSSCTVADIDDDGKPDIVHTNGDTMDAFLPKPYHGVRWLRNLGERNWEARELGLLVGALAACVADFDGDRDADIAAVGMLPLTREVPSNTIDSVVWWEQVEGLHFKRHALEQYGSSHAACTAGDVNADGLQDLIVGGWNFEGAPAIEVYYSMAEQ